MRKTIYAGLIASLLAAAVISTTSSGTNAFASDKNDWGDLSSDLAKAGKMGGHASDPIQGDDDRETPRGGVGNLDLDGGGKDHPSESARTLKNLCDTGQGTADQCP